MRPQVVISISALGAPAILRKFGILEEKVQRKVLRGAMRQAAKSVQAAAKGMAPVDTGELAASIDISALRRSRKQFGMRIFSSAASLKTERFYSAYVEFGSLRKEARPFLGPALRSRRGETLNLMRAAVAAAIHE